MTEQQRLAGGEVRLDGLGVQTALLVVRREDHDDVGLGARLGGSHDAQALGLGLGTALAALGQPDPHVDAGVAQVEAVGVALAAVPEHRHLLAGEDRGVGVGVVEKLGHGGNLLVRWDLVRF